MIVAIGLGGFCNTRQRLTQWSTSFNTRSHFWAARWTGLRCQGLPAHESCVQNLWSRAGILPDGSPIVSAEEITDDTRIRLISDIILQIVPVWVCLWIRSYHSRIFTDRIWECVRSNQWRGHVTTRHGPWKDTLFSVLHLWNFVLNKS